MPLTSEQLAAHNSAIGGSRAAAVCGWSRRMTQQEAYLLYRGEIEPRRMDDETAWMGDKLEPTIADHHAEVHERKLRRCGTTLRHREVPYMIAHPDRLVVGERRGLECKWRMHADGWGPAGTDEVPKDELYQCVHYLAVTGYEAWDLEVLFGGVDFRTYTIGYDQGAVDGLIRAEGEFWQAVRDGVEPALDYNHPTAVNVMQRLHRGVDGRTLLVGQHVDETIRHWHGVREDALKHRARYDRMAREAKAHLLDVMGTAAELVIPDVGSYVRRHERPRSYTVERQETDRLTFQKASRRVR